MRILPRRLRSLAICFSIAFLIAILATGISVYRSTRATVAALVDKRIVDASRVVAGPAHRQSADAVLRRIRALSTRRDTGDIGFELEDAGGKRLGGNIRLARPLPVGRSTLRFDAGIDGLSEGRALVRVLDSGLRLTVVAETEPFDSYYLKRIHIYLIGFGSIVLIVIAGVAAFGLLVHRRIAELRETVAATIDGDMRHRVPVSGAGGEFDRLAIAFNRMLDRIGELMAGIRNVSDDIAHDLRTPLARLRSRLVLLSHRPDAAPLGDEIDEIIGQCDEMLDLFGAILRIVEVEGGSRRAAFARLDPAALAAEIGTMMQPIAADSGHTLTIARGDAATIEGDRQLLVQALLNLVENALRHTPAGTRITIASGAEAGGAVLILSDDGPGIPAEARKTALRRFGRLDKSRHGPGHGLGLPLVAAIARLHGGRLELGDAAPGLRAKIWLPFA